MNQQLADFIYFAFINHLIRRFYNKMRYDVMMFIKFVLFYPVRNKET